MSAPWGATDDQQRILRYWWMLELFSPQQIPKLTPRSTRLADRQVVEWKAGLPLPWEMLEPPTPVRETPRVWQHTVYLGVYHLEKTHEHLHHAFGEDTDAYDERPGGRSACAGLLMNGQGLLVADAAVLSSAMWAVAQIAGRGVRSRTWSDGFSEAAQHFAEAVDEYEGTRRGAGGEESPPAQDSESLLKLLGIAHEASGIVGTPGLATDTVVIQSVAVSARRGESAEPDFLNSFFLDDLAAVRTDVLGLGSCGEALADYLTSDGSLDVKRRVDVIRTPGAANARVKVDRLPKGRWPSNPQHGLSLRQQFAVNQALTDLAPARGLMGVNGPPGTGKTTMLRDVLAGNVVERARSLARLSRPEEAFTSTTHRWTAQDGHKRTVRQLRPELTGFEMVVASANNAAVENVTAEIPARDAIDDRWRGKADYFADIAAAVLNETDAQENGEKSELHAWGLVAARLGNKRNRSAFHSAFWFDKKDPHTLQPVPSSAPRMQTRLAQWHDGTVPRKSWDEARTDFARAERTVDALLGARRRAQERLRRLPRVVQNEQHLTGQCGQLRTELQAASDRLEENKQLVERAELEVAQAEAVRDRHIEVKPGILEVIFTFGRAVQEWRATLESVDDRLRAAEHHRQQAHAHAGYFHDREQQLRRDLSDAELKRARASETLAKLRRQSASDRKTAQAGYPDESWTGAARELHAPWLDEELDTARSELFLAALQLHEDFLANAAGDMLPGLRAAVEVVAGSCPPRLEPEKLRAAWQLFFLVVPMVSTTFASFGRMFGHVGREAIGWLLIDEAGQASPQYAASAIWRAQRVVVVGDPLQLQPVVTIPQKVQRDIAVAYGVSETWIPPYASVQTLADRVSCYGTALQQGEQRVWVSAPLTVHRRCDDPMFTLFNEIAYNGIMVNGVKRRLDDPAEPDLFDSASGPIIFPSHWVDEPAPTRGSHLQENQIARLEKALAYLFDNGISWNDVIAISPFRAVADRLATLTGSYPGLRAGTIHAAQGREASVVFLVLGGDPGAPGAKAWAASTVNLVNVAASRAKRRLYVIGDRASWAQHNYFHQLAGALIPSLQGESVES